MKAKILTFSSRGDTTLLEYDPATADMVNKLIAEYEAKTGAQPFDTATGGLLENAEGRDNEWFAESGRSRLKSGEPDTCLRCAIIFPTHRAKGVHP
jgi:hypothetical protein